MDSPQKLWNISVQQVQIFLKAVEVKNFTRAANFFNFTPSMVSKTIAFMEDELDIKLFIRKPHELSPTPAALMLANEWRQFVGSFNNSIKKAQSCVLCYRKNLSHSLPGGAETVRKNLPLKNF